jgi:ABC-type anion transport system duplicated permease subunit
MAGLSFSGGFMQNNHLTGFKIKKQLEGKKEEGKVVPRRYMLLSLMMIGATWCLLTFIVKVNPIFLPSPLDVVEAFHTLYTDGLLVPYTLISLYRVLLGFFFAALLAIPLGVLMASSKKVEGFSSPFIGFVRYLPVTALIPLMILYFGTGELRFDKSWISRLHGSALKEIEKKMKHASNTGAGPNWRSKTAPTILAG